MSCVFFCFILSVSDFKFLSFVACLPCFYFPWLFLPVSPSFFILILKGLPSPGWKDKGQLPATPTSIMPPTITLPKYPNTTPCLPWKILWWVWKIQSFHCWLWQETLQLLRTAFPTDWSQVMISFTLLDRRKRGQHRVIPGFTYQTKQGFTQSRILWPNIIRPGKGKSTLHHKPRQGISWWLHHTRPRVASRVEYSNHEGRLPQGNLWADPRFTHRSGPFQQPRLDQRLQDHHRQSEVPPTLYHSTSDIVTHGTELC